MGLLSDQNKKDVSRIKDAIVSKATNLAKELSAKAADHLDETLSDAAVAFSEKYEDWLEKMENAPLEKLREQYPIEMILRKKTHDWIDAATIENPTGSVIYTVTAELEWGRRILKLLDENKQAIILIEENRSAFTLTGKSRSSHYIVSIDGRECGNAKKTIVKFHPEFTISHFNWKSTENLTRYIILNQADYIMCITDKRIANTDITHLFFRTHGTVSLALAMLLLQTIGHRNTFSENYQIYRQKMIERDMRFNVSE